MNLPVGLIGPGTLGIGCEDPNGGSDGKGGRYVEVGEGRPIGYQRCQRDRIKEDKRGLALPEVD